MTEQDRPTFKRPTFSLLRFLQADNLLDGTTVLERLSNVNEAMNYRLVANQDPMSPVDALHELQRQAGQIPQLGLQRYIAPGEENAYHVDLTLSYETVLNQVQRVTVLTTAFLGHLKAVHARIVKVGSIFNLWWTVGAREVLETVPGSKLLMPEKTLQVLATDEFSTTMEEKDIEVAAVIEATTLLLANLKASLKQAEVMYQLGRDQINVSLADSRIPNTAVRGDAPTTLKNAPVQEGAQDTLRQMFGDRVKVSPAPVDDEFPLADETDASPAAAFAELKHDYAIGVDFGFEKDKTATAVYPNNLTPEQVAEAVMDGTMDEKTAESLVGDFVPPVRGDSSNPVAVELVGGVLHHAIPSPVMDDFGNPGGDGQVLMMENGKRKWVTPVTGSLTSEPTPAPARVKGEALVVNSNVSLAACGLTGKLQGVTLAKGKTKLHLTAQTDPSENDLYRYMGADVPLARLTTAATKTPSSAPADDGGNPLAEAVASALKPTLPEERTVTVQTDDPFATVKVTAPVSTPAMDEARAAIIAAAQAEDDFPLDTTATPATAAPAPPASEPVTATPVDDEADIFANITVVADVTPARHEKPEDTLPEPAKVEAKVEAPAKAAVTPAPVTSPTPALPPAASTPAGLFRSRAAAPGTAVISKPFTPPRTSAPAVDPAGLDSVL